MFLARGCRATLGGRSPIGNAPDKAGAAAAPTRCAELAAFTALNQ